MAEKKARAKKPPKENGLRAYATDTTLRIGLASMIGDLVPPRRSASSGGKGTELESVCPTCYADDPEAVNKLDYVYRCPEDDTHGPFTRDEVLRATVDGDVIATVAEIAEVKSDDAGDGSKPAFEVNVHYADEVEANVVVSGVSYLFRPSGGAGQLRDLLVKMLASDGRVLLPTDARPMVLIGTAVLRGHEKLFQLRAWRGQLMFQELARPEDLYDVPTLEAAPINSAEEKMLGTLLESRLAEFNPETYRNDARVRLAEFIASRAAADNPLAEVIPFDRAASSDDSGDLMAMLQASLNAASAAS